MGGAWGEREGAWGGGAARDQGGVPGGESPAGLPAAPKTSDSSAATLL